MSGAARSVAGPARAAPDILALAATVGLHL